MKPFARRSRKCRSVMALRAASPRFALSSTFQPRRVSVRPWSSVSGGMERYDDGAGDAAGAGPAGTGRAEAAGARAPAASTDATTTAMTALPIRMGQISPAKVSIPQVFGRDQFRNRFEAGPGLRRSA